jgi:enediyne biosynthesis protein E9
VWGLQKKQAVAHWANRIELLAMVDDTSDGTFYAPPPSGAAIRPDPGPIAIGTFNYSMSEQSLAIRAAANDAMRRIGERQGLARFMALTETQGVYCAHPLGGCPMAESPDLGAVDDTGRAYGYEGLYCIDGSIAPTSLGVNPSLTISALSERCAERLVARAPDLGLPAPPPSLSPGVPPQHIGERVVPGAA